MIHTFTPYGAAKKLFECQDPEVVLSGSAGTGKSMGCLQKLVVCCFKYPKTRALMVRKTRESLTTTGLVTLQEHVIPDLLEAGIIRYYGGSRKDPAKYIFPNGSSMMVAGMDKATKIMSSEFDIVFVQEAIELSEDDWEKITTRLRNYKMPYQQIIADTNPDGRQHWLRLRALKGTTTMLQSVHEDNPTLYNHDTKTWTPRGKDYISKLDALTGVNYQRLRLGKWVSAEGVIFDAFNHEKHVVDPFDIPDDWRRYWVLDFGYTNPFVCQMWAEDGDGRLYLYREFYRSEMIVEDHAKMIMDTVAPNGEWLEPKPHAVIADHDGEDRRTFTRHTGLRTKPAKKEVMQGIEAVKTRLRDAGDGKPRIMFMRDALVYEDPKLKSRKKPCSTIAEIGGYVWSAKKTANGQDMPEKADDHGMDAMRYVCAYKDRRTRQNVG